MQMVMSTVILVLIFVFYLGILIPLGVFYIYICDSSSCISLSGVSERMIHPPLWPLFSGKPCTSLSWGSSIDNKGNDAQTKDFASSYL